MEEDNEKIPPEPKLDVHTLDLEFWPNLDIGNEFLHVDWLEDVRHPVEHLGEQSGRGSHTHTSHAHTSKESASLDDAIDGLEGIDDALAVVGDRGGPDLGVDAMLHGIEDGFDFLPTPAAIPADMTGGMEANAAPAGRHAAGRHPESSVAPSKAASKGTGAKNKRRLRWTPELHSLFVEAVQHLKGPEKATPKGIMLYMKVDGLTTFHIKSHLQKYRMNCSQAKAEAELVTKEAVKQGAGDAGGAAPDVASKKQKTGWSDGTVPSSSAFQQAETESQRESHHCRIEQALLVQMQMQKKLQEQLEEQRKLQLSIQAQEQHIRQLKEELHRSQTEDRVPRT